MWTPCPKDEIIRQDSAIVASFRLIILGFAGGAIGSDMGYICVDVPCAPPNHPKKYTADIVTKQSVSSGRKSNNNEEELIQEETTHSSHQGNILQKTETELPPAPKNLPKPGKKTLQSCNSPGTRHLQNVNLPILTVNVKALEPQTNRLTD